MIGPRVRRGALSVGTTAGTVAPGDDSRFASVSVNDLPAASTPTGAELLAGLQSGSGVKLTAQQVAGSPVTDFRTLSLSKFVGYSNFTKTRPAFTGTDGALCDLEPYICNLNSGGTLIQVAYLLLFGSGFQLNTGTNPVGKSSLTHAGQWLNLFNPTYSMDTQFSVTLGSILPSAPQAFKAQIGFMYAATYPNLATDGMYFEIDSASNNWFACVTDDGVSTRTDTTIPAVVGTIQRLRVFYDADPGVLATKFFIDGTLRATITNAIRVVDTAQPLNMGLQIVKSLGATAAALSCVGHSYSIDGPLLVGY